MFERHLSSSLGHNTNITNLHFFHMEFCTETTRIEAPAGSWERGRKERRKKCMCVMNDNCQAYVARHCDE